MKIFYRPKQTQRKPPKSALLNTYQVGPVAIHFKKGRNAKGPEMIARASGKAKPAGKKGEVSQTIKAFAQWEIKTGTKHFVLLDFLNKMEDPHQMLEAVERFAEENNLEIDEVMELIINAGNAIIRDGKE